MLYFLLRILCRSRASDKAVSLVKIDSARVRNILELKFLTQFRKIFFWVSGIAAVLTTPVHANLTPLWGYWTLVRFADFKAAKYIYFLPIYGIFYSLMIFGSIIILRKRLPSLKFSELIDPIIKSVTQATTVGFILSFIFYFFIEQSYLGFFDPKRGLFEFSRTTELYFGILWVVFLTFTSFLIAVAIEKRALNTAYWKKDWESRGITIHQIDESSMYSTGVYHIFFAVIMLIVCIHRGEFSRQVPSTLKPIFILPNKVKPNSIDNLRK